MGELVDGRWQRRPRIVADAQGRVRRQSGGFRGWVRADGAPGPGGRTFPVEAGRYHLIVALACPWAHRTSLARAVGGLKDVVSMDVVEPLLGEDGWTFASGDAAPTPGSTHDRLFGATHLHTLYSRADAHYSGRVTTPVLWDGAQQTIVSNESADIMRMLGTAFAPLGTRASGLVPQHLLGEIDTLAQHLQTQVNSAVYRCRSAATKLAHEKAVGALYAELDRLEGELTARRFLLGARPCEADWRLFVTLVRFDRVYHAHFQGSVRRLRDYPALFGYTRELYQWPGVAETVHEGQMTRHTCRGPACPCGSGPLGGGLHLEMSAAHGRDHLVVPTSI